MDEVFLVFIILVFVAAFLFAERLIAFVIGPQRAEARRMKKRLQIVSQARSAGAAASLLRNVEADNKTLLGRWVDTWPGMATINHRLRGAGYKLTAGRVVFISVALGAAGFAVFWFLKSPVLALVAGVLLTCLLPIKITIDYNKRLAKFEEGLVEGLDVMTRSLKAGQPFNESMLLVAEELEGPISEEFGRTFGELNYGVAPKQAFAHMIERVPSVTLKALTVAVLLQRETGGNLAELLTKINGLLRGRFRFYRRVRTLSAEGRVSAMILIAIPFVLFAMLSLTSPSYVGTLLKDPTGHKLLGISAVLMVIGVLWIRKIMRIDV